MSATYSGNPKANDKDGVRFLCGDTGPDFAGTAFKLQDEEIQFLVDSEANIWMAAAMVCDKLLTLVTSGGVASKSIGSLRESYSQQTVAFYTAQAKLFRERGKTHQLPYFVDQDQLFSMKQFDNPEATSSDAEEQGTSDEEYI